MSILIKGMKMPSSCYDCELIDIVKDCPHYDIPNDAYCQIPWLRKRRHENCPLISVPPHGRLIDADALKASIRCSDTEEYKMLSTKELHNQLNKWIDGRQTIIPAEEGET